MRITFCGHASFLGSEKIEEQLLSLFDKVIGQEYVEFYLGGYGGFDEFCYSCCKKYKKTHPKAQLIFITPYITEQYQKKILPVESKRYDEIIYPEIENKPLRFAILYRNKWMVEKADFVVSYIEHDFGGAYKTYCHAKRKGKMIFNLANKDL